MAPIKPLIKNTISANFAAVRFFLTQRGTRGLASPARLSIIGSAARIMNFGEDGSIPKDFTRRVQFGWLVATFARGKNCPMFYRSGCGKGGTITGIGNTRREREISIWLLLCHHRLRPRRQAMC
jgi:hypothetical protein